MNDMVLRLRGVVSTRKHVRCSHDERFRCDEYIASYVGTDGHEYRKSFSCVCGIVPTIPEQGLHSVLNSLSDQVTKSG